LKSGVLATAPHVHSLLSLQENENG